MAGLIDDWANGRIPKLIIETAPRHGKLLAHDTPILTTTGWTTHGQLKPGDYVFGRDGKPVRVLTISPNHIANREVEFTDGSIIKCHSRHEWVVRVGGNTRRDFTLETDEIMRKGVWIGNRSRGGRGRFQVDQNVPVDFPEQVFDLHPYILGAWLGDGSTTKNCITHSPEDVAVVDRFESLGIARTSTCVHQTTGVHTSYFAKLYKLLKDEGILGKRKRIPELYLIASQQQRLELLAGLVDTDGYVHPKTGRVVFSNTNSDLIADVESLIRSLGWRVTTCAYDPVLSSSGIQGKQVVYQLCFNPTCTLPCALERKRSVVTSPIRRMRAIRAIRECEPVPGKCIQVEGGIYLVGRTLIPTHNSELTSRRLPAYLFGLNPDETIIACSSTQRLASRMSRDVQRIIDGPAYRRLFPNSFLNEKNVRTVAGSYLRNNEIFELVGHDGAYISSGIGGTITGMGGQRLILDDYLKNRKDADSRLIRENQWEWYASTFTTRGGKNASILITTTRWHEDDIVGRILALEKDDWVVLKLPAICESPDDPYEQRAMGEALWPNKYSLNWLLKKQAESLYNFASLFQQNPAPRTGGFIKVEKITTGIRKDEERWPRVRYWDLGGSDSKKSDRTSGTRMRAEGIKRVVEDCLAGQWSPAERNRIIVETAKQDSKLGTITWIEKVPGLAVEVIQTLVDLFIEAGLAVNTEMASVSKTTRADPFATAVEGGRVEMCVGEWNREFREELQGFPYASNDDRVDSTSGAYNKLIERPSDDGDDIEVLEWGDLAM